MQDQAQIVIIGGGIFGTSIAYHLAKAGCTDVVLVEKGELTSGTTFHSVGLVSQFRTSPALMKVMNYTINLYNELAQGEGGDSLGWHTVGSLRLASSQDRLKALQREVSRAQAIGLTADIISPAEVLKIYPELSDESLYGAVYVPDDGHIDPSGITYEFARLVVSRQLEQIWTSVAGADDQLFIAVPAYMRAENLGLLLGIAAELNGPIAGMVDAAVAASSRGRIARRMRRARWTMAGTGECAA